MSNLDSFDDSPIQLSEIIKLVQGVNLEKNPKHHDKYAQLGRKFLSTLMAQAIFFETKDEIKNPNKFLDKDIAYQISKKALKQNNGRKLEIAMGKLYRSKDMQTIHKIQEDLLAFIQISDGNQSQQSQSISSVAVHQSTQFVMNEPTMTSVNVSQDFGNNLGDEISFLNGMNNQEHYINVQKYMDNIQRANTLIGLLIQFKLKTFQLKEDPKDELGLFKHTSELSFINFLNQGQTRIFKATTEGTSKQESKQKASRIILTDFFKAFPYVFKDFLHSMKNKGAKVV